MNSNTIQVLKSAEWYSGRKIDVDEAKVALESRGYTITESFIKFYIEFGNIEFYLPDVEGSKRSISFNLEKVFDIEFDEVIIEEYPKITGSTYLTPIGEINGQSVIVIDENEIIYILYGGSVIKLGKNSEEALNNLCNVGWSKIREHGEYKIPDWW